GLLHHVERLARIDRAELLAIADAGEPIELKKIGEPDELLLVGIADHRGLVEQYDGAAHGSPGFGEAHRIAAFEEVAMAPKEARDRHRRDAGLALEHLDERVLDREAQHRPPFLAQNVGDRLEDRAL